MGLRSTRRVDSSQLAFSLVAVAQLCTAATRKNARLSTREIRVFQSRCSGICR